MVIIDTVINTLLGGLTLDPAGMHCPSWDDAFVSSFNCNRRVTNVSMMMMMMMIGLGLRVGFMVKVRLGLGSVLRLRLGLGLGSVSWP